MTGATVASNSSGEQYIVKEQARDHINTPAKLSSTLRSTWYVRTLLDPLLCNSGEFPAMAPPQQSPSGNLAPLGMVELVSAVGSRVDA